MLHTPDIFTMFRRCKQPPWRTIVPAAGLLLLVFATYDDADVEYHRPGVENLTNALLGIHRGLVSGPIPTNYQGIALYCDWETSESEWSYLRDHFLTMINR